MKILEVCFSLSPGGVERFVVDLSNELGKNHDVTLLTLKNDQVYPEQRNFYRDDIKEYVKYDNLGLRDGKRISSLWKVYKYVKTTRPQIVHINGHSAPYYFLLVILFLYNEVQIIQTIHSDIGKYRDCLYLFLGSALGKKLGYHFVALSNANKEDLDRVYPHANTHMILNGRSILTCTNNFLIVQKEIRQLRATPHTLIFLHIARFHEAKNQSLLINAFNRIVEDGFDAHLVIIGAGFDSGAGLDLKKKACSNIHFMGAKKNVSDYYLSSDVFCLSSIYEGLPISVIEAQLCGLPIVSTPVCGVYDVVQNYVNGILSVDYSLQNYKVALQTMIEDYDRFKMAAKKLKGHSLFIIERCANNYEQLFSSLIGKRV